MGGDASTGEMPAGPEDPADLARRLDPVRTLLHRTAGGDRSAASALVDVLGPRIHGLAVHMTGSSARAGRLTVQVLRSCLHDAAELAAGGLSGEAAALDRARRTAVSTRPSGDVRSLAAPDATADRTRDRREVEVMRTLLELPPAERALVESAAQGRFALEGTAREQAAAVLGQVLDRLVPFGTGVPEQLRALAALDALALADAGERARLRSLTADPGTAAAHRHAIEAAAVLTLLTAIPPSRDLHEAVLEGIAPPAETAYRGTYATPVLGTDSQHRLVGPPAMAGTGPAAGTPAPAATAAPEAHSAAPAPSFSFHERRASRPRRGQRAARRLPWFSRGLATLGLVAALVLSWGLLTARSELAEAREFAASWSELSVQTDAEHVDGRSDNGSWRAVLSGEGFALHARDVAEYPDEVLQLWADGAEGYTDLGVLEVSGDGEIRLSGEEIAGRLLVTRENTPRNRSGTPSDRVVASLDPVP